MAMMAYKATMYMVFLNYSLMLANWIGGALFPVNTPAIATKDIGLEGTSLLNSLANILSVADIQTLALTAGVLALFAFSLLIPTIPFVFSFFALSGIITESYIVQIPIPDAFKVPVMIGVGIIYFIGISQYASRSSFSGS